MNHTCSNPNEMDHVRPKITEGFDKFIEMMHSAYGCLD